MHPNVPQARLGILHHFNATHAHPIALLAFPAQVTALHALLHMSIITFSAFLHAPMVLSKIVLHAQPAQPLAINAQVQPCVQAASLITSITTKLV